MTRVSTDVFENELKTNRLGDVPNVYRRHEVTKYRVLAIVQSV